MSYKNTIFSKTPADCYDPIDKKSKLIHLVDQINPIHSMRKEILVRWCEAGLMEKAEQWNGGTKGKGSIHY
jgi:hypothetical protein